MNKKFRDLNEQDNIETISSVLKSELDANKKEYTDMMSDGIIDDEELNRIITTMQDLEFKARTLNEKITGEKEKQIMEEIINIINSEQVNMINIKNNPVEIKVEKNNMEK
jgi:hypothetical protein